MRSSGGPTTTDEHWMKRALVLARRGAGWVSPNPMVGAVVVREDRVVGEGHHQKYRGAHAEPRSLAEAGGLARGAEMYISLEPCCHQGNTPPCVPAIIESGVRRVIIAHVDPDPRVCGQGIAALEAAGVEVTIGVCEERGRRLNAAYLKRVEQGRSWVCLKLAMTLDGHIADSRGESRWLSGEIARAAVHRWRSRSDAVVVGIGTVLADDPLLTVRLAGARRRSPLRIVLDSNLRLGSEEQKAGSRLLSSLDVAPLVVACREEAAGDREQRLRAKGVEAWRVPSGPDGRLSVEDFLRGTAAKGYASLLVEGGSGLATTLLRERLVDRLNCFLVPKLVGRSGGLPAWGDLGVKDLGHALGLTGVEIRRMETDVLVSGVPG